MWEYLKNAWTARRVVAMLLALCCFAVCLGELLGFMQLGWWAVGVLFLGLLIAEWAG